MDSRDKKLIKGILDIGIQLTKEKDRNHLLNMILNKSMEYTNCDAGTLYLYDENSLVFKIMKTNSQNVSKGEHGEKIDMPPVSMSEENICAYSAIHKEVLNIQDVRSCELFDFSGPKRYDEMTGYCTCSMLVIPITNQEDKL